METNSCCFFGHRTINVTAELTLSLNGIIKKLITEDRVDTFLFGSRSQFNDLCYEQVTKLKEAYPHIQRIYVRAEFPDITENYEAYLLERYEGTDYPETIKGAGKAVYVERNRTMIEKSRFCVVYCRECGLLPNRKSGTLQALDYAVKKGRVVIKV